MNKKIAFIILISISLIGGFYFVNSSNIKQKSNDQLQKPTTSSKNIDYKASFAIYTNGTFRIFTAPMYHNLSEDVFIEASNPNIVNIKRLNITWRDFFETLPLKLDENCLTTGTKQTFCSNDDFVLQFYLNEERNQSALDQVIKPEDKLLVTYEKENSPAITQQLQSISETQ